MLAAVGLPVLLQTPSSGEATMKCGRGLFGTTLVVLSAASPATAAPATGTTVRASVSADGRQADADSGFPAISADGRYVAFESSATNLVAGDSNLQPDIFVRDLRAGTTTLVSVGLGRQQANMDSYNPSVSADGRYVAFESFASNL